MLFYIPAKSAPPLFISVIIMLQLPSKRVMDGPSFDIHRAESSHQHVMAGPATLDPRRAEAASKHVRALNSQFARSVSSPASLYYFSCVLYHEYSSPVCCTIYSIVSYKSYHHLGIGARPTRSHYHGHSFLMANDY